MKDSAFHLELMHKKFDLGECDFVVWDVPNSKLILLEVKMLADASDATFPTTEPLNPNFVKKLSKKLLAKLFISGLQKMGVTEWENSINEFKINDRHFDHLMLVVLALPDSKLQGLRMLASELKRNYQLLVSSFGTPNAPKLVVVSAKHIPPQLQHLLPTLSYQP